MKTRKRICGWMGHNIKWGGDYLGYDPNIEGDYEAVVSLRRCLCGEVYHLKVLRWGKHA